MASHVTRKRNSVSPHDLRRDRCRAASNRGNGRPTKETMRWSKNPWARCVAPSGMTGTLLSPPRLTPRRRSAVSYTHLRAHETRHDLVCRLLLEKKKKNTTHLNL